MTAYTIKRTTVRLLSVALIAIMAIGSVKAQDILNDNITLTVNPVMPPYTGRLSDYFNTPGKIGGSILVKSRSIDASSYQFYLHVSIINIETEASVGTRRSFVPGNPRKVDLSVIPNTTLIQYADLQQAMSEQNLEYSGFTREQVSREGLPPGQYMIKLTPFVFPNGWNGFNQLESRYSPPFTIAPATIAGVEPPIIINPVNNSKLNPEQKQSLQFNWTMQGGAPAGIQYKLKIIEVNDKSGNFRDMLHNDRYPAFFETTVSAAPMYLYTAANPPFKEDKTYAFVVRAFNAVGTTQANFKNNGYSEINTFSFKDGVPVVVQRPPKDTPPIIAAEKLAIFVPYCSNCQPNAQGVNKPSDSMYQLLGNTLNPNAIASVPNAQGAPRSEPTSIRIPANTVAVNNAKNFYLRWEDKSSLLKRLNPQQGEGIVYQLQIRDAKSKKLVWEKQVWNNVSYEQTKNGLPFMDKQEYTLHISAVKGVVAQRGFEIVKDRKGQPIALASSCECKFTYMELPDVPDLEEYTVKGKLSYKFEHHPEKYPITTRTATLTRYISFYDVTNRQMVTDHILTPRDDRHSVPIQINNDGTFETTVYAYRNNGLITASLENGTQFETREFFNIELNSPYYRPLEKRGEKPTKTRVDLNNKVIDVGEITFNVWSYTLEIEVTKGYSKWVSGELTGSYRDNNPQHVKGRATRLMFGIEGFEDMPYYEGDIPATTPISKWGKSDIATGKVENKKDAKGVMRTYVTFDKLICNYQSNDYYYINVDQTLEVNGKKEEYYTNEFNHDKFQYRPQSREVSEALNSYRSNFLVKRKATLIDRTPPKSTVKGKLVFADPSVDRNKTQPLANTDIALVVTYLLMDAKGNKTVMDLDHLSNEDKSNNAFSIEGTSIIKYKGATEAALNKLEDRNAILATTRTDANGNFEFKNFAQIDSLTIASYKESTSEGSHEFAGYFEANGRIKRTVRVVVNNSKKHYWLNPNTDIDVQPNTEVDVRTLTAYLDTYKLRVKPVGNPYYELTDENKKGKVLKGAFVKINREPMYQGEPEKAFSPQEKMVGENGCEFVVPKHLIRKRDTFLSKINIEEMMNWMHIHVFTKDTLGEHAFIPEKRLFPRDFFQKDKEEKEKHTALKNETRYFSEPYAPSYKNEGGYRFTNDFKDVTCEIYFRLYPKFPIISGRVLDAENTKRSVESGEVHLKVIGSASYQQDYGMGSYATIEGYDRMQPVSEAKRNGFFSFQNLIPNIAPIVKNGRTQNKGDSNYQLFVKARGYTLSLYQQEGKEKVENIKSNIWFPAEPMKPKMGQQIHFPMILMRPNGWITGCVVDEKDNPMRATVNTTRSRLVSTEQAPPGSECSTKENTQFGSKKPRFSAETASYWFKVHAPSGYTDTLFIKPDDQNFFSDTILIPAMPEGEYKMGKVVVKERLHRIRIVVRPYVGRILTAAPPGISGITVKMDIPGGKNEVITNEKGVAEFVFKNADTNFRYEIIPPDNSEYIGTSGELTNANSKNFTTYSYSLRKGATVNGKVTTEGKPVPNARIWVMNGNNKRETTTDSDGKYTLRGIKPMEIAAQKYNAVVHCGAPGEGEFSNLLGKEKEVSFATTDGNGVADFDLEWFEKANIKSLHGFKITVTDVQEDGGGVFRITGTLHLKETPGKFEMKESISQNPAFSNLKVKINNSTKDEKGRPYFEVAGDAFSVGMKLINVKLKAKEHEYAVQLKNEGEEFLKIAKDGVNGGFIRSKARIEATSFNFTSENFTFDKNQFFISDLENNKSSGKVTSVKSYLDKTKMEDWQKSVESGKGHTYGIHDSNGKPLKFLFIGFDAVSPLASSRLLPDGVISLKPDVWFINPLLKEIRQDTIRIDLPDIRITPDKVNEGGVTLKNLSVKFENWTVNIQDCKIDASRGGISSNNAVIRTGKLDIPARRFILNKTQFVLDEFEAAKIPLGKNVATIDINPGTTFQFGVDPKCGMDLKPHLMFSMVNDGGRRPVGSIKNLPGFTHPLEFQSVKLISNGEDIMGFAPNSKKMRLYDVVDFLPYTINSYDDEFNLDGAIDYGIPRVATNINYKLIYKKKGGRLNLELGTSDVSFTQVGTFKSLMSRRDTQKITDGLVELYGTIEESGHLEPIRVVVTKKRESANNYRIWMEREDPKKAQTIRLGGTTPNEPEFIVDRADMKIINNDWDLLRLKLVPSENYGKNSGFGSNPLYFELRGELRTDLNVSDQSIDLVGTNIDPATGQQKKQGLTGFVFKYDYASQELIGDITLVDQNIAGVKFGGVIKMAVGRPGFYFGGAGTMQTSPFGKINAGFLLGYYDKKIPAHVWDGILQYSARKEVPCSFTGNSFRGFYALGALSVPFVTFDYSFDFGIASGGVSLDVAAEASVFGSFPKGRGELGFSAMIFANANAYLKAVTCTSISASAKATIKGEAALQLNHPYTARLTVCGDVAFGGCLKQGLPTLAGCVPILSVGKSFAFHAGLTGEIDLKSSSLKPRITEATIGAGRCAMGSTCQMGVIKDDPCGDWKEDEGKVKQIEEQQRREQEEQQKQQK